MLNWAVVSLAFTRQASGAESAPNAAAQQSASEQASGTQKQQQKAQARKPPAIPPGMRLLSLKEGRALVRNMAWADDEEGLAPDCSHLVHALYQQAGYPYPYVSSTDLYHGTGQAGHFLRVHYPHPGDLVVWPGHVGIVVNPRTHSFFSTTSAGAQTENYTSAYWLSRGHARYYRYLMSKTTKNSGKSSITDVRQQEKITRMPD
jgi:hypothetical protein